MIDEVLSFDQLVCEIFGIQIAIGGGGSKSGSLLLVSGLELGFGLVCLLDAVGRFVI